MFIDYNLLNDLIVVIYFEISSIEIFDLNVCIDIV